MHLYPRRRFLRQTGTAAGLILSHPFTSSSEQVTKDRPDPRSVRPKCARLEKTGFKFRGHLQTYLAGVCEQWLKIAPLSNPAMLEMFRDRDRLPRRSLEPWAGEFAGKYLTAAVQVYRIYRDPALRGFLANYVAELIACQDTDGYLGPWPKENRLTGWAPNAGQAGGHTWDAWGHYHIMIGLLLWHDETGAGPALEAASRIADLACRRFLGRARLVDTGSAEMNLALIHALCLLYERSPQPRYLEMAAQLLDEFAATDTQGKNLAGNYFQAALAGAEFFQMPKPRWESLHPIMGLAGLYWITGRDDYRRAFEQIWWSIVKLDRHNNGGFSSGEQAQGNPYHPGAIETCCTIAWIALSVEMLRLTENPVVADEIELSTLNSVLGLHSPTGRWVTYNTPMDGVRKASAHDIVFQARAGSPELNCCSVNGARGLGLISEWALMSTDDALILNWYGPSEIDAALPNGNTIKLRQETNYPRDGRVRLLVETGRPGRFALKLRIPYWSPQTRVTLNGTTVNNVRAGTYCLLDRHWKRTTEITLAFDFSFHYWAGERECAQKTSIYQGPLLLTYDRRFNTMDPDDLPSLDARGLAAKPVFAPGAFPPMLLLEFAGKDGRPLRLCDFASAGQAGNPYRSWLPVVNAPSSAFSKTNPLRTSRA